MTPDQLIAYILGFILGGLLIALGYWWYKKNKPVHTFVGVDFGANSIQPRRIKNLFGPFRVKRNDGTTVQFPAVAGYHIPRQDGKGNLFFGDLATGQLFKPRREGDGNVVLDFAHGIFLELALADGRVKKIVEATKAPQGITLQHIFIGICVLLGLMVIIIYQYFNG